MEGKKAKELRRYLKRPSVRSKWVRIEQVEQDKPYTFVKLTVSLPGFEPKTVNGYAKVCYPDVWEVAYGIEMATDKAVARFVRQLDPPDTTKETGTT